MTALGLSVTNAVRQCFCPAAGIRPSTTTVVRRFTDGAQPISGLQHSSLHPRCLCRWRQAVRQGILDLQEGIEGSAPSAMPEASRLRTGSVSALPHHLLASPADSFATPRSPGTLCHLSAEILCFFTPPANSVASCAMPWAAALSTYTMCVPATLF